MNSRKVSLFHIFTILHFVCGNRMVIEYQLREVVEESNFLIIEIEMKSDRIGICSSKMLKK